MDSRSPQEIVELLQQRFPSLFQKELFEEIQQAGEIREFKAGEIIMDVGRYIQSLPLLISGSIKILRDDEEGHELFLYYLNPGDTCAMSLVCCMGNERSKIRAIAEEDTEVMLIPIKFMDEWMSAYPSWKAFVMNTYQSRLEEMLRTIDSIAFTKMDERLLKYLKAKAKATHQSVFNITHQDIAYELSTSREVISRLLKQMEKIGLIKLGRNRIELL